jgi:putative membrane protein
MERSSLEKKFSLSIVLVSIVVPVLVAFLFFIKLKNFGINVAPMHFLPPIYASINALTAVVLVIAVWAIKNKKQNLHQRLMQFAIALSLAFLATYVAYHMTTDSTKFGGEGAIRYVYFFLLISHILLSITVIPLVLFSYVRALAGEFERHKKLTRITFPLWLYVAVTGVIVYLMISPYYVK